MEYLQLTNNPIVDSVIVIVVAFILLGVIGKTITNGLESYDKLKVRLNKQTKNVRDDLKVEITVINTKIDTLTKRVNTIEQHKNRDKETIDELRDLVIIAVGGIRDIFKVVRDESKNEEITNYYDNLNDKFVTMAMPKKKSSLDEEQKEK